MQKFPLLRQARKGRIGLLLLLAAALSGCGTSQMQEPIGIGPDRDELKQSPCACFELPQRLPGWVRT